MSKSADAFRTISEVADWMDTPAHVLRFWESKFTQVKPVKRAGGRRYYRPADMRLLGGIKKLLHEDGMTIKGAQKILREKGIKHVSSLCTLSVGDEEDAEDVFIDDVVIPDPEDRVIPFSKPVDTDPAPQTVAEDAVAEDVGPEEIAAEPPETPSAEPEQPEPEAQDQPDDAPQPETIPPEPEPVAHADITPEPDVVDSPEEVAEPVPETSDIPDDEPGDASEPAPLPGFIQQPEEVQANAPAPSAPDPTPVAAADPDPTPAMEMPEAVVDAPADDPPPGALSVLARITHLTPETARQIAPIVEQLRARVG
ncbi:MerR family transcriptional regulator [Marivita sp. S0852]|uniref:MerR family transcriptional regulator n=1 Tax=Marivita sp. S0852 TaxID=3373893 RepID=UPI0039822AD9